jgi:hypothetical protein
MFEARKKREAMQGMKFVSKSVSFKDNYSDNGSDLDDEEFDENEMILDSEEEDEQ